MNHESSNFASVRCRPEGEDLQITFYHNGQRKDLRRNKNDSLHKTLQRISLKLQSKAKKKKKEESSRESVDIVCCLLDEEVVVSEDKSNAESFIAGRKLKINNIYYELNVNPPTVIKLMLPECIMAGYPIIPNVKFELADMFKSKFSWFKSSSISSKNVDWQLIGDGPYFTPCVEDIGFYIKCKCYPGNETSVGPFYEECISEESVKACPGICLFDQRHMYTPKFQDSNSEEFRMVTYNILANVFADSDYAKSVLFPYCPPYAIKSDYRRQLLTKELIGYHADLICLQECSKHEYEHYLYNWMLSHGYEGFLSLKLGEMSEGEAFFFRTERYLHLEDLSVSIRDALSMPCNNNLMEELLKIPRLLENIKKKSAIGQVHLLSERHNRNRHICVLNTHLYYKRYSVCVRLLQISILMNYLYDVLKHRKENISVIVSGDLNSLRGEPLLEYLIEGKIDSHHSVWSSCEKEEENGLNMDLICPFSLQLLSGFPDFTSYVPHCKATLDYIFADGSISKEGFIPLPSASEIEIHTAIPSVVYPSDHLAVVLDMKWK